MDFTYNPFTKEAHIKLSRTNLQTLLDNLDDDVKAKVLVKVTEDDWLLSITPQEDAQYYGEPLVHGDLPDYG